MTKDQNTPHISDEPAAPDMRRTVSELDSVISDLRSSAARLKRIPAAAPPPDGYVEARTACAILNIKRPPLDRLADKGKIGTTLAGWKKYYKLADILRIFAVKFVHRQLSPSTPPAPEGKMSPEQ